MRCGISTASLFPEDTAKSLEILANAGVKQVEIFLNTYSELKDSYVYRLISVASDYGIKVESFHPFTSELETFYFFTPYSKRFDDGLELYKEMFSISKELGAKKFVMHGANRKKVNFVAETYAEKFNIIAAESEKYGVILCHENVSYCSLGNVQAVQELRPLMNPPAFVLDLKQLRRSKEPLDSMLKAMGQDIRHVHLSDFNTLQDCMPPGKGEFNFRDFLGKINDFRQKPTIEIELYRHNYNDINDLLAAMNYVNNTISTL